MISPEKQVLIETTPLNNYKCGWPAETSLRFFAESDESLIRTACDG